MSEKTLRVGLVGTGFMGRVHANCWVALPGAELAAIADPTAESREKCPGAPEQFEDWATMLANADIDIVDVCTPTPWHPGAAIAGLEAGKHVLCEKPMALTLPECDEMLRAGEKTSANFMIAHVIRFWAEYAYLKEAVASGKYGKLRSFTCLRRMAVPMYNWEMWTHDEKRAGGIPFEGHIHDVDYVRYLMGDPKSVYAVGVRDSTGIGQMWASYTFNDERRCSAEGSWGYQPNYPFQHAFVAVLEDAVLDLSLGRDNPLLLYRPNAEPEPIKPEPQSVGSADEGGNISDLGGYYKEIEYFAACIRDGVKPSITTPQDARESVRLLLAQIESMETGQVVTL
ncbi:MAG TPA: Gfo/Idh/MocA family oxidoreductase [Armatimonadota bacterium]|jgi:predicted dehydrogenase